MKKTRFKDIIIVSIAGIAVLAMLMFCLKHLLFRGKASGSNSVTARFVNTYDNEIKRAAAKYSIPPALVKAVILQESRFNRDKVGGKGEIGLMQLMPSEKAGAVSEWARIHKCSPPARQELFKVPCNLDIGCWYLARALKRWEDYDHCIELALVQYNAGPSRAKEFAPKHKSGEVIHRIKIASTKKYVNNVMRYYREFSKK